MPFKSKAQQKWMFSRKPEMAKKWAKETNFDNLSARVKTVRKKKYKGTVTDNLNG